MTLVDCLRAEILKSKNSFAVWLTVAGTIANLAIFFAIHFFSSDWISRYSNPWKGYVTGHYEGIAFMMLPLFVIILCSLVTFMEHRSGTWGNLYTLPVSKWQLYWSKLLFTLLLFIAAHLVFMVGLILTGILMGGIRPSTGLWRHFPDWGQLLRLSFETIWSILGLLGLHFWLSWRFPHFIVPLTIGIVGFVTVSILGPAWYGNHFIPYAYPIQYMPAFSGEVELLHFAGRPLFYWLSPLYFGLFIWMGYRDVKSLTLA